MKYLIAGVLKVRSPSGVKELRSSDLVTLPKDIALQLIEGGRVKPFYPDCFSRTSCLKRPSWRPL